jgi:RsiW-degrading membrane proteinase PrsW (M82 family)
MDPVDKDPLPLLAKLFLFGMLSTLPAILIETAGSDALLGCGMPQDLASLLLMNFGVVAVTEECSKYVFLRLASWHDRNFDCVFDGIVYAAFCGLGFAVAENISYVFTFGPGAAIVRAFTAIPGHCVFAVFMGSFYGRTKLAQVQQRHIPRLWNGLLSLAVPIFCHGVYDTLAGIEGADAVFFVFLLALVLIASATTKHVSRRAERISIWY